MQFVQLSRISSLDIIMHVTFVHQADYVTREAKHARILRHFQDLNFIGCNFGLENATNTINKYLTKEMVEGHPLHTTCERESRGKIQQHARQGM